MGVDPTAIELLYQVLYEFEPAARRAIYDAIAALYLTGARLNNQVRETIEALTTAATEFALLVRDVETALQEQIEDALATLVSAAVAFSGAVRASVSESMAGVGEAALANSVAQQATGEALADAVAALGEWGADAGGAVLDFFVSPFRDALTGLSGQSLARSPDAAEGVGDAVDAWIDNFTLFGRVYSSGFELVDALRIDSVEALLLRRAADALNAEISDAAAAAGVHFVPVAGFFDGHAPCESEPWVNGIEGQSVASIPSFEHADGYFGWLMDFVGLVDRPVSGRSFHPNLSGHRAYAGVLASYIRGMLLATEGRVNLAGLPANPAPDPSRSSGAGPTGHGTRSAPDSRDSRSQDTPLEDSKDTETPSGDAQQVSLAGGLLVLERTSGSNVGCSAGAAA